MRIQNSNGHSINIVQIRLAALFAIFATLTAFGKDAPIEGDGGIEAHGNVYWQRLDAGILGITWNVKQISAFISDAYKPNSKYKRFKHWVRGVETDDFDRNVVYVTTRGSWDTLTIPGHDYIQWRVIISTSGKPKIEKGWDRKFGAPFKAVPED